MGPAWLPILSNFERLRSDTALEDRQTHANLPLRFGAAHVNHLHIAHAEVLVLGSCIVTGQSGELGAGSSYSLKGFESQRLDVDGKQCWRPYIFEWNRASLLVIDA